MLNYISKQSLKTACFTNDLGVGNYDFAFVGSVVPPSNLTKGQCQFHSNSSSCFRLCFTIKETKSFLILHLSSHQKCFWLLGCDVDPRDISFLKDLHWSQPSVCTKPTPQRAAKQRSRWACFTTVSSCRGEDWRSDIMSPALSPARPGVGRLFIAAPTAA